MYVKFDRVADGGKDNKGSCADFIHYMMKEDNRNNDSVEWWFDQEGKLQMSRDVQDNIDKDHHKLGRHRAKFTTGSISPSVREWAAMGANEQERRENFKQWAAEEFTKGFAANFRKHDKNGKPIEITPDNVKIYFKFEYNRYYKGTDEEQTDGKVKAGQAKQGFNCHIHFIIATKTADGKYCVNPQTKNRREFHRIEFFQNIEQSFDSRFNFKRQREDSFAYAMAEGRAKRLGAAGLNFAGNFYDLTSGMSLLDALSAGTKGSERGGKCDEEQEREQQKQKQKEEKEL